ncbi:MAG: hypothetical protein ACLFSQ_08350, partial [Candidatus Zixiibacteriota bacterium]
MKFLRITKKWWFYLIILAAQFLLMPVATKNFSFDKIAEIIPKTLSNSFLMNFVDCFIYYQSFTITMLILLFLLQNKMKKIFAFYVFVSYLLYAVLQNIAITEKFGLSFVTINIVMFIMVALSWLHEAFHGENSYRFKNIRLYNIWMIPVSAFLLWWPLDWRSLGFDFHIKHLLFNGSTLAFCPMTPIFLTIMTLNIPKINILTYRITSLIGIIIGFYNMINFFNPGLNNLAVMHIPLL